MRYLVCREDAVRPKGRMRDSEAWPIIVDIDLSEFPNYRFDPETAVRKAFELMDWDYSYTPLGKAFVVIPMENAARLLFKEKKDYEVVVTEF